jgi:hypothetical protein
MALNKSSAWNQNNACVSLIEMKRVKAVKIQRAKREKVTREEALKRMETFPKRKEKFIAAIREGTRRNLHS